MGICVLPLLQLLLDSAGTGPFLGNAAWIFIEMTTLHERDLFDSFIDMEGVERLLPQLLHESSDAGALMDGAGGTAGAASSAALKRKNVETVPELNDSETNSTEDSPGARKKKSSAERPAGTRNPEVVKKWPFGSRAWGFNKDCPQAEKTRAYEKLKRDAILYCNTCGTEVEAHKHTFEVHLETSRCRESLNKYSNEVKEAALKGKPAADVPVLWNSKKIMIMTFAPINKVTKEDETAALAKLQVLIGGVASSYDISFNAQCSLFAANSSFRAGLAALGSKGLGSYKAVSNLTNEAVNRVQCEIIIPAIREAIQKRLSISVAADESPTPCLGNVPILMVHFFFPGLEDTRCVDIVQLEKAPTAASLMTGIKLAMLRPGYLTEAEWTSNVHILVGDHAAYVQKAAKDSNMVFSGDPPHAVDLVIKAILTTCQLKPLFMAVRKLLNSKSYIVSNAIKEFRIPKAVCKTPTHRWGYWAQLIRMFAVPNTCAVFQQFLIWYFFNIVNGDEDDLQSSTHWMQGLPFKLRSVTIQPEPESVVFVEEDEQNNAEHDENVIVVDMSGWDEFDDHLAPEQPKQFEAVGTSAEPESDSDQGSDSEDEREDVQKSDQRKVLTLQVLNAISNPQILSLIRLISSIVEPLRLAQVNL